MLEKIRKMSKQGNHESPVDILFVTPPYWDVYGPFSAVPCLIGELKKYGIKSKNLDLGIMVFHENFNEHRHELSRYFLSKEFYEKRVQDYIDKDFDSYQEYLAKLEFLNDKTLTLRDFQKIYPQLDFIQQGVFDFIVQSVIDRCSVNIDLLREVELNRLMDECDFRVILQAIETFGLTECFLNLPPIAGISITSCQQFVPALAIIKILKTFKPDIKIIVGGSFLETVGKSNPSVIRQFLKNFADFGVIGEGETAVRMLIEHIMDQKHALSNIPNLLYQNRDQLHSTNERLEDVASLCAPDYEGLDLSLYLAQEPTLAYQTSRGCHWGHCAFCNHDTSYRHNFRTKKIETVVSDLKMMTEKYHVRHFQFVDEAIEPRYFIELVEALSKEEFSKKIKWFYYSRISPFYNDGILQKAKKCGCEMVMFGVETFCQRLLTHIKKGTTTKNILSNLEAFHRNGIKTHAWMISCLPTQTKEELLYDVEMLERNFQNIDVCSMSPFLLDIHCDMYKNPERFGITKTDKYDGYHFESINDGKTIKRSELDEIVEKKYRPLIEKHVFSGKRYLVFFNQSRKSEETSKRDAA